jgi:hypothetical protein
MDYLKKYKLEINIIQSFNPTMSLRMQTWDHRPKN